MAIFQKVKRVVADCAAYELVEFEKDSEGYVNLKAGDVVTLDTARPSFMVSSVFSSAIEDNRSPIETYELAVKHGHPIYFLVGLPTVISAHDMPKGRRVKVDNDTLYRFQGKIFNIVGTGSNNLHFVEQEKF